MMDLLLMPTQVINSILYHRSLWAVIIYCIIDRQERRQVKTLSMYAYTEFYVDREVGLFEDPPGPIEALSLIYV